MAISMTWISESSKDIQKNFAHVNDSGISDIDRPATRCMGWPSIAMCLHASAMDAIRQTQINLRYFLLF